MSEHTEQDENVVKTKEPEEIKISPIVPVVSESQRILSTNDRNSAFFDCCVIDQTSYFFLFIFTVVSFIF